MNSGPEEGRAKSGAFHAIGWALVAMIVVLLGIDVTMLRGIAHILTFLMALLLGAAALLSALIAFFMERTARNKLLLMVVVLLLVGCRFILRG